MVFLSSHGSKDYWDIKFKDELFLVFGKESVGLPKSLIKAHKEQLFKIPLYSDNIRSLNLANAVGICTYEGLRQLYSS
jgi:tRNA (cytidine/uridine-2'-O-)-methyltransferase